MMKPDKQSVPNPRPPKQGALPNSTEAEMAVLGAMLLNPQEVWPMVCERLAEGDFSSAAHQTIFREIVALEDSREAVDPATLTQWLRDKNQLEEIGGAAYLAELVLRAPPLADVEHYIDIVFENSRRTD